MIVGDVARAITYGISRNVQKKREVDSQLVHFACVRYLTDDAGITRLLLGVQRAVLEGGI